VAPTREHNTLAELFRNRPTLAPELMRLLGRGKLPAFRDAAVGDTNLSTTLESRADMVVVLSKNRPVLAIAVEVQRTCDSRKRRSWPLYEAALGYRHQCPACVLVIATSGRIARWAARPIPLGPTGSRCQPLVIGGDLIPRITDLEDALRNPELAVLSAMAHGKAARGIEVAKAAVAALAGLDAERGADYFDLIVAALPKVAPRALEALIMEGKHMPQSEWARRHYRRGEAEGEVKGKAEGRAEGKADILLDQARTKFGEVGVESEARIRGAADEQLTTWARRILTATSIDEVFGDS
jgi:hypothetical protein